MKVIRVIEDEEVIKKILKHLGLWDVKARPQPRTTILPKIPDYSIDYTDSQLPVSAPVCLARLIRGSMSTRSLP
jgi:hypothetical protein